MGNDNRGIIREKNLQQELDIITGEGNTEVTNVGDVFEIYFTKSKRYYEVDKNGNVGNGQDVIEDKYPGNIQKGINEETLLGTEESPYEIWCIEDLVEFSQNYKNYQNSYILLKRNLNFKSKFSYLDGRMLNCNSIEELMKTLTDTTKSGFTPIGLFEGTFDGNGYAIRNIYINVLGNAGLFETSRRYNSKLKYIWKYNIERRKCWRNSWRKLGN